MRLKLSPKASAMVLTSKRFGQSRHTHQQAVTSTEYAHEHLLNHVFLSHDDFADFRGQFRVLSPQRLQRLFVRCKFHGLKLRPTGSPEFNWLKYPDG